jgi:hypothetical protein
MQAPLPLPLFNLIPSLYPYRMAQIFSLLAARLDLHHSAVSLPDVLLMG